MMEYSCGYAGALTGIFTLYGDTTILNIHNTETTLDQHNVFNKLFVIDTSSDEIEVPVFARAAVEHTVRGTDYASKIVIPMYINKHSQSRRTADSIVKNFFTKVNFGERLQKVTTNKEEIYYGGKGIILDKDFNILLLCTIICKKADVYGRKVMAYYKPVVHVNPQVFLRNESLINKSILKKIIPFYLSHKIDRIHTQTHFRDSIPIGTKPQIVIDDMNKFIENPIKPSPQKCSDNLLNQILIDNADDVLNQL